MKHEAYAVIAPSGGTLDRESRRLLCPTLWCIAEEWYVRPDAQVRELWHVGEQADQLSWQIADSAPCCPHCGTTLAEPGQVSADDRFAAVIDQLFARMR